MSISLIGQTLGHYKVVDQLGAGGMGVVYRAQDLKLGRQVALKVLPAGSASSTEAIERFRREARTASALNHPNICTIYGFDEHEGQCYLAMELLDGEPLDQRLGGRPLDLRAMIEIAVQVADAIDAAHTEGILHRDIKPANIFITKRGQVKVLDFGLAKLTPSARRISQTGDDLETRAEHFSSVVGTTVGTIAYMSPEQARGEDLDPRTDLFSFGVVLYEMATGRQSFPGHTTAVVFDGILNRDPAPPSTINAALPPDLDRIIAKALEKDRTMRYQTAADLRADLHRLRRDSGTRRVAAAGSGTSDVASAATVAASSAATTVSGPASGVGLAQTVIASSPALAQAPPPAASPAPASASPKTKTPWLLGGLAALVAIAAVGVALMMRSGQGGTPPPAIADSALASTPSSPSPAAPAPAEVAPPSVAPPPAAAPPPPQPAASAPAKGATGTGAPSPAKKATAKAAPATAPAGPSAREAEAAQRLEVAKAKLSNNLIDQGVADLRQIVLDYPGIAIAADASFLAADALAGAGRDDDAMAAYIEFEKRFAGNSRVPESKLHRASLLQRSKAQPRQQEGYALLGEIAREFPGTPQSRAALQAKRQIETQRRQLRATDPVLNVEVPALLVTLRTFADQFPSDPATMVALNQLATAYADMDRHQAAADVWERMGALFPGNPMDMWFRLGETYERRLRNPEKAREAYARVPPESPRYRDAQQRLNRR